MGQHIGFRSGNPALGSETFRGFGTDAWERNMTIQGTVNKTGFALMLLVITATISWNETDEGMKSMYILIGFIVGFVVALITMFNQEWAPITVPIYALLEGLALGALSWFFEQSYPGIVAQAIFCTFGTLFALLLAYKSKLIKPTENFKLGVVAATGGIAFIYIISIIMSLFGSGVPVIHEASPMGIIFSLFVITIAALNLVLDFDFIEQGAEMGAPKHMEWYGAFGLLVTLIWLYLEMLRLLAKLQSRR